MKFNKITSVESNSIIRDLFQNILNIESIKDVEEYYSITENELYSVSNNERIVGLVGLISTEQEVVIKHIAIQSHIQNKGLGTEIINKIHQLFPKQKLVAETDNDAVGFYTKLGFKIISLGEKYPGIIRYKCIKEF
ncbi:GNAT family N-acetyltransferase [Mammaliicoccus sciuri]|uniref:GNAT family N-acetyltransferase n=1 Tax=Mammaliicoccus TaxID=2803850 RepID=UPI001950AD16|nr:MULTISPECIES: GNAT family N-acetyltransferase [Mammaliicoccus]MCD8836347.1 GNAT family N-acetyltransferase [Mammaliicoccus sciuri]MCJ0941202.1 GNAT family N-acetyltransferase [Mammaliicoccus sciuri]MCJ0965520.1 GNAT family N-acetyltransferase [Mammaliicoccus sciuri]MEB6227658.1 GNAT family N-acetyltransferase [Mammaliicoccus sciuri]